MIDKLVLFFRETSDMALPFSTCQPSRSSLSSATRIVFFAILLHGSFRNGVKRVGTE
jgi:hypothetical protein